MLSRDVTSSMSVLRHPLRTALGGHDIGVSVATESYIYIYIYLFILISRYIYILRGYAPFENKMQ